MAKSFDIKIAKLNSLPTVKKVMEKIASGKDRTPVEALLEEGIREYDKAKASLGSVEEKALWFSKALDEKQKEMKSLRANIQATKFAIILGKKWFDEFKSREENTLDIDGKTFTFELSEEAVEI